MRLPIPESIIDELREMKASAPIVVAENGEVLNAEDTLGLIALAQRPGPELDPIQLVNAGLNGFAVELLVESIRKFKDFEKFGPFRFSMRGVSITFAYDPESDEKAKARRKALHLPEQDPHWAERSNGDLASIAAVDETDIERAARATAERDEADAIAGVPVIEPDADDEREATEQLAIAMTKAVMGRTGVSETIAAEAVSYGLKTHFPEPGAPDDAESLKAWSDAMEATMDRRAHELAAQARP